jgi:tetratricopeptide (TPR) repeat protein
MDAKTLHRVRDEAMRDFDDGKLPEAEAELSAAISQAQEPLDPWTAAEFASCLQDRATVRRYANRWGESLGDLARSEQVAMRLAPLPRRMLLPNIYYMRALLYSTPHADVFNADDAATALMELRRYSSNWIADSLEAELAFLQKEWEKAAALFQNVTQLLEREGWMQGVAGCRLRRGDALIELNDLAQAEAEVNASLQFLEPAGPPDMLAGAQLSLARIRAAQGRPDQAWELVLQSLAGMESLVRRFRDIDEQQRFLENKLRFYDRAFEIARTRAGAEGTWRAWSIAERAKSFYLCQLVANSEIALFDGIDPGDVARLRNLESRLDEAERNFSQMGPQERARARGQEMEQGMAALSREKRDLLAVMMKQNPKWGALKAPPAFDIQLELSRLDAAWIAISYFWITDDSSGKVTLHVFWSDRDRQPRTAAIPWSAQELETLDRLRALLRGTVSPAETTFPEELALKVLPRELQQSLSADSRLLMSPHERLKGIPLQTVPVAGGQLLIQKAAVQFVPTLTLLLFRSTAAPADKVLLMGCPSNGFGDPRLEDVETEIAGIARIWRSQRPGRVRECILAPHESPEEAGLDTRH